MPTLSNSHVPPPKGWDEFEDIVLSAARVRWKSPDFVRNARQGQRQAGVDIFGRTRTGELIGIQCKNTPSGLTKDIIDREVVKASAFSPPIARLVIATTARRDGVLQQYARHLTAARRPTDAFGVSLLFWEDIWHDISADEALVFQHFPQYQPRDMARPSADDFRRGWTWVCVSGSSLLLLAGTAGTMGEPSHYPLATFPNDSTVILGGATRTIMDTLSGTSAEWGIPLSERARRQFQRGYLVIAAIRYFAGLHSKVYDSKVKLEVNGSVVDYFGLREQPAHHSDYFHRLVLPELPLPQEIADCQTIYSWPVLKNKLVQGAAQKVRISIDKYVRWDIDYLGLLVRATKGQA